MKLLADQMNLKYSSIDEHNIAVSTFINEMENKLTVVAYMKH